jgi:hypothetical protein
VRRELEERKGDHERQVSHGRANCCNREGRDEKPKVERKKKKNYIRNLPRTTQNHEVRKEHHLITCLLEFRDRKEKETTRVWLGFLHLLLERTRWKD